MSYRLAIKNSGAYCVIYIDENVSLSTIGISKVSQQIDESEGVRHYLDPQATIVLLNSCIKPFLFHMSQIKRNIPCFCPLSIIIKEKKKRRSFSSRSTLSFTPQSLRWRYYPAQRRALDRSAHTIDILKGAAPYLCVYFISGSSRIAMEGYELRLVINFHVLKCSALCDQ